jgi:fructose-1,6-bisphosphatase/inositol monophosphatase family enzyme
VVEGCGAKKSPLNLTKEIDVMAEELIVATLEKKLVAKLGIRPLVVFIDPINGREFIESLQGGWFLISVYDRRAEEVVCAVAGDIFLDRLYWASRSGYTRGVLYSANVSVIAPSEPRAGVATRFTSPSWEISTCTVTSCSRNLPTPRTSSRMLVSA